MIGTRDTYALLQRPETSKNQLNETVTEWVLVEPLWVSKRMKSGSESVAGGALASKSMYELVACYLPNLNDEMRIEIEGDHYAIIAHDSPFRSKTIIHVERTSHDRRS